MKEIMTFVLASLLKRGVAKQPVRRTRTERKRLYSRIDTHELIMMLVDLEDAHARQTVLLNRIRAAVRALPRGIARALKKRGALEHDDTPDWVGAFQTAIAAALMGKTIGRSPSRVKPNDNNHPCLHPDALVMTEFGYRPIHEVPAGSRVLAAEGTFRCVRVVLGVETWR